MKTPDTEAQDETPKRDGRVHLAKGVDPNCYVCQHKDRDVIEMLFMRWTKAARMEELSGLNYPVIERHMQAVGLYQKRAENTEDLIAAALGSGFDRGVFDRLDGDQLVKLVQWQDKKLGKVKEHHNTERPVQVFFFDIPSPGGVTSETKAIEAARTVQARVLPADQPPPMLPPSEEKVNERE